MMASRGRRLSVSAECSDPVTEEKFQPVHVEKDISAYERVKSAVQNNFLFSSLNEADRKLIFDAMFETRTVEGQIIIRQGPNREPNLIIRWPVHMRKLLTTLLDPADSVSLLGAGDEGDNFYVVDTGEFDVFVNSSPEPVVTIGPGGSFGELALMYNTPRAATVKCRSAGVLWALDRSTFRNIILVSQKRRAKRYEQLLSKIEVLKYLSDGELAMLADSLEPISFADKDVIIRENEDNFNDMRLYFVEAGCAEAYVTISGEDVVVGDICEGDYFGEKALIEREPRLCSVRAKGPLTCVALGVSDFERLMGPCKEVMERRFSTYHSLIEAARTMDHASVPLVNE